MSSVAVSPPGLEIPAKLYERIAVDVLNPAPSTMKLAWKTFGATRWSAPQRCTFAPISPNESECQFDGLGPGWVGDVDQVRLSFPNSSEVSIDRVAFSGPPAPRPLIGAIRWDAWFPDNQNFVDASLYTDFNSRHPELGWFDEPGTSGRASALAQHHLDLFAEMQEAHAAGIDFWAFNWYPGPSDGFPGALDEYQAYLATLPRQARSLVGYALIVNGAQDHQDRHSKSLQTLPYWTKDLVPQLVRDFRSPAYVKVDGNRPLLYLQHLEVLGTDQGFGKCQTGCWHLALSSLIDQTEAAGLGRPYLVNTDSDPADSVKYGLDGLTSYGPDAVSAGGYPNSGHKGWNAGPHTPASTDIAVAEQDSPNGHGGLLAVQPPLTPTLDHRPVNAGTAFAATHKSDPSNFWFDYPTYSQWQAHFADVYDQLQLYPGRSTHPGVALIYSWNEVAEGGGVQPSSTYGSYLLDAIGAVRFGAEPAYQWNIWDDSNVAIKYRGTWTEESPSPITLPRGKEQTGPTTPVPGAYGDDEHIDPNRGPSDSATIRLSPSTAVRILATTGPDRGIETVTLDGASTTVDLYSPVYRSQVVVFQQSGLPATEHRLRISTTGSKNRRSTNTLIGVDAFQALVVGIGVQGPGPLAPNRLTAAGLDNTAQLSWDPVTNVTGYSIYRSDSPTGPWQRVGQIGSSLQRMQWRDPALAGGSPRLWYYEVRAEDGDQEGLPGDAVPAITLPDMAAGGQTSNDSSPSGHWSQVMFKTRTPTLVDELDFSGTAPSGPVSVEVTADGGHTWTQVYRAQGAVGLGGSQWLTFPPIMADGVRVTGQSDPPLYGVYLR